MSITQESIVTNLFKILSITVIFIERKYGLISKR